MCDEIVEESRAPYRAASAIEIISWFASIALVALAAFAFLFTLVTLMTANAANASWLPDPSDRINNGFEFSQPAPQAAPAPEVEAPASLQPKASVAKHKAKATKPPAKKKLPVTRPAPRTPTPKARPLEAPMPTVINPYVPPHVEVPAPKVEVPAEPPVKRKAHFWSCDPSVKHHFFKFCDTK